MAGAPASPAAPAVSELFGQVDGIVSDIERHLVETRKLFHMNPELSWEERETSAEIKRFLGEMGVPMRGGLAKGTGLTAEIDGGLPGPTIAYRADIDALPMHDAKDAPYRSRREGVMHACGHDAHATIALGLAEVFQRLKGQFPGRLRLLFQPAEEAPPSGAPVMIADGAIDGVDAIWCVHVEPNLDPGVFGLKRGVLTAAVDMYKIRIRGKSSHSARPHLGTDAILIASRVIGAIYQTVQSSIDPYKTGVLNVGMCQAGQAANILAETCDLCGTIRTYDPELRETIPQRVEKVARAICEGMDATMDWELVSGSPPVINDLDMIQIADAAARDAFGPRGAHPLIRPSTGGDDFSCYGEKIPMCMIRAGARVGPGHGLHTPLFDVADETMPATVRMMSRCLLAHLSGGAPGTDGGSDMARMPGIAKDAQSEN